MEELLYKFTEMEHFIFCLIPYKSSGGQNAENEIFMVFSYGILGGWRG